MKIYAKILLSCALLAVTALLCMESDPKRARLENEDEVTIQTLEGQEFKVSRELAVLSITLKNLIEDSGIDFPLPLPNVSGAIWQKIQEMLPDVYTILYDQVHKVEAQQRLHARLRLFNPYTLFTCINAINYLEIPVLLEQALLAAQHLDVKKITTDDLGLLHKDLRNTYLKELTLRTLGSYPGELAMFKKEPASNFAISVQNAGIYGLCINNSGKLLYSAANDSSCALWNIKTLEPVVISKLEKSYGVTLALDEARNRLYVGKSSGFIDVRNAKTLEFIIGINARSDIKPHEAVMAMALVPGRQEIVTASDAVRVIRVDDRNTIAEFALPKDLMGMCLSVSPDGRYLVVGTGNTSIDQDINYGLSFVCDMASGTFKELSNHGEHVAAVHILSDARTCVIASLDGVVDFFDLVTGTVPKKLYFNLKECEHMHICAAGTRLFVGSKSGIIQLWDTEKGVVLADAQLRPEISLRNKHYNRIWAVRGTQDAGIACVSAEDGSLFKWDVSLLNQFAKMSTVQAQVVLRYLQEGHVLGWQGITTIIQEKKTRFIPSRAQRKDYKED